MAGRKRSRTLGWERRQEILKYLLANGSASISAIGQHVDASPATIHRDLELLAENGLIERVHGGALAVEALDDAPVATERHKRVAEKQQIADVALQRVTAGVNSIFLEASTTVAHLVPALRGMTDKVFVTNSPEIALELASSELEVMIVGGNLRFRTLATMGPLATHALQSVNIDLAFIGVSALDVNGLAVMNAIEAQTKSAAIQAAQQVVALADGAKLGTRALVHVAVLDAIDELITDAGAPLEEVERLRTAGLTVTIAPASSHRMRPATA